MKSNVILRWLIPISFATTMLIWLVGALNPQGAEANNEYRTCVWLVNSHSVAGTVDGCRSERDLMRSLH